MRSDLSAKIHSTNMDGSKVLSAVLKDLSSDAVISENESQELDRSSANESVSDESDQDDQTVTETKFG